VEIADEYAAAVKTESKRVQKSALSFNAGARVNFARTTTTDE